MMTSEDPEEGGIDPGSQPCMELCAKEVLKQFEPQSQKIRAKLTDLSERQTDLTDKVSAQCEKFVNTDQEISMKAMLDKTRSYHEKLVKVQKDMSELSERSGQMKVRALKLQELKQKEALKREHKRIREQEREDMLVAKPVSD